MNKFLVIGSGFFALSMVLNYRFEGPGRSGGTDPLPNLRKLSPSSVGAVFLGQRRVMADLHWIRILQYCGESRNKDEEYTRLLEYCLEAITLDPEYEKIYHFGAVYLARYVGRPREANLLLRRGLQSLKDQKARSRLLLYLAAIQFEGEGRDRDVIRYLTQIILDADYPPLLPPILANALERSGDVAGALRIWRSVRQQEKEESELWIRASKKIAQLM